MVHKWRAEEQAILVGTHTVIQDNPSLTTRDWTGLHPIRLVIDKESKLSKSYAVFNNEAQTISINKEAIDFSKNVAQGISDLLFKDDITSVIIEGGAKTLQSFIDENLWDEARVFTGPTSFESGIKAPSFSGSLTTEKQIIKDILKIYIND